MIDKSWVGFCDSIIPLTWDEKLVGKRVEPPRRLSPYGTVPFIRCVSGANKLGCFKADQPRRRRNRSLSPSAPRRNTSTGSQLPPDEGDNNYRMKVPNQCEALHIFDHLRCKCCACMDFACKLRKAIKDEFKVRVRDPFPDKFKPHRWMPIAGRWLEPNRARIFERLSPVPKTINRVDKKASVCNVSPPRRKPRHRSRSAPSPEVVWWFGNPAVDGRGISKKSKEENSAGCFRVDESDDRKHPQRRRHRRRYKNDGLLGEACMADDPMLNEESTLPLRHLITPRKKSCANFYPKHQLSPPPRRSLFSSPYGDDDFYEVAAMEGTSLDRDIPHSIRSIPCGDPLCQSCLRRCIPRRNIKKLWQTESARNDEERESRKRRRPLPMGILNDNESNQYLSDDLASRVRKITKDYSLPDLTNCWAETTDCSDFQSKIKPRKNEIPSGDVKNTSVSFKTPTELSKHPRENRVQVRETLQLTPSAEPLTRNRFTRSFPYRFDDGSRQHRKLSSSRFSPKHYHQLFSLNNTTKETQHLYDCRRKIKQQNKPSWLQALKRVDVYKEPLESQCRATNRKIHGVRVKESSDGFQRDLDQGMTQENDGSVMKGKSILAGSPLGRNNEPVTSFDKDGKHYFGNTSSHTTEIPSQGENDESKLHKQQESDKVPCQCTAEKLHKEEYHHLWRHPKADLSTKVPGNSRSKRYYSTLEKTKRSTRANRHIGNRHLQASSSEFDEIIERIRNASSECVFLPGSPKSTIKVHVAGEGPVKIDTFRGSPAMLRQIGSKANGSEDREVNVRNVMDGMKENQLTRTRKLCRHHRCKNFKRKKCDKHGTLCHKCASLKEMPAANHLQKLAFTTSETSLKKEHYCKKKSPKYVTFGETSRSRSTSEKRKASGRPSLQCNYHKTSPLEKHNFFQPRSKSGDRSKDFKEHLSSYSKQKSLADKASRKFDSHLLRSQSCSPRLPRSHRREDSSCHRGGRHKSRHQRYGQVASSSISRTPSTSPCHHIHRKKKHARPNSVRLKSRSRHCRALNHSSCLLDNSNNSEPPHPCNRPAFYPSERVLVASPPPSERRWFDRHSSLMADCLREKVFCTQERVDRGVRKTDGLHDSIEDLHSRCVQLDARLKNLNT